MSNSKKYLLLQIIFFAGNAGADTIVLSDSAPLQVRGCFQTSFTGYVASYAKDVFDVYVPLIGCDNQRQVPPNCGPQVADLNKVPADIRKKYSGNIQILHQRLLRRSIDSVTFGGDTAVRCPIPKFEEPKPVNELPPISWISPTTSKNFIVAAKLDTNKAISGTFYGVDWGNQKIYGNDIQVGKEITLQKSDFKTSVEQIFVKQDISFGGAVGFQSGNSQYVILNGKVTSVDEKSVRVRLGTIESMPSVMNNGDLQPAANQGSQASALEVATKVVTVSSFDWDARTSLRPTVQVNIDTISIEGDKRRVQVQSPEKVKGTIDFIKRRP